MNDADKAVIRYAHAHGHIPRQDHRGMLLAALDEAERERDELRAMLAEAEAALANERGTGEPPSAGWVWSGATESWSLAAATGRTLAHVERWGDSQDGPSYWTVATDTDTARSAHFPTARAAMRAADEAVGRKA